METTIKWQTGEPTESGDCLVIIDGNVTVKYFYKSYVSISYWEGIKDYEEITAWCKISDIKP